MKRLLLLAALVAASVPSSAQVVGAQPGPLPDPLPTYEQFSAEEVNEAMRAFVAEHPRDGQPAALVGPPAPRSVATLPGNRASDRHSRFGDGFNDGLQFGADAVFTVGLLGTGYWAKDEYVGVWNRCAEQGMTCTDNGLNRVIGHSDSAQFWVRSGANLLIAGGSAVLRRRDSKLERIAGWVLPPVVIFVQSYAAQRDRNRLR